MNDRQLKQLFKAQHGPVIQSVETTEGHAKIRLHVPTQLVWFEGHFPQQAVLPGVVQIDWAGKIGRVLFTSQSAFSQLTNIKFKTMLLPGTRLALELSYSAEKGVLKFHYFNDNDSFSLGSFKFVAS